MTLAFLLILAVLCAVLAFLLDRSQRNHTDLVGRLLAATEAENTAHRAEVQMLLQRLAAPQMAAIQHATATDDGDYNPYPLNEEEQAQAQDTRLMAEAVLKQIHDHETEVGTL